MRYLICLIALSLLGAQPVNSQVARMAPAGWHTVHYDAVDEHVISSVIATLERATDFARSKYSIDFDRFRAEVYVGRPPQKSDRLWERAWCCELDAVDGVHYGQISYDHSSSPDESSRVLSEGFMTLVYVAVQHQRGSGWIWSMAPEWFTEGLASYDTQLIASGNRSQLRATFAEWTARHRGRLECCGSNSATLWLPNQALGGAAFAAYLAERFGDSIHERILRSAAPSFERALLSETGSQSLADLYSGFTVWR